jgi:hypothetical protein
VKLTTHLHLMARLRTSGATSPYSLYRRDAALNPSEHSTNCIYRQLHTGNLCILPPRCICMRAVVSSVASQHFPFASSVNLCAALCLWTSNSAPVPLPEFSTNQIPPQCLCQNSRPIKFCPSASARTLDQSNSAPVPLPELYAAFCCSPILSHRPCLQSSIVCEQSKLRSC